MRKFKVTASSNSSTLKVTPYVINKGQSGEYYGLKNAEDNQVLTSAPNNWKSKKGAIAWAKKKGYEIVESACGKKSVRANTAKRRRSVKASSPNGYSRDERFALAGEVLYRAGVANQEHGAGIAYYLPGNYVLTFNSENNEMQSPDLIFTIWNPNAKDEFDYAGILYTDLNAANRGTDATEALYNKGFGSLPERKEFTNTDNAFKKALDWVISKAMSRSNVNSSTKRRNRKAVKAGKSLNMKAGLDHSSDWMLRGYKFDGEDVTTERIDFQDDVRKAVRDMFNDPDIETVDLYRIDTEQDTTGVFEDEEFFATFTREDILSSTKPKKFGVKASKSAKRRKAIKASFDENGFAVTGYLGSNRSGAYADRYFGPDEWSEVESYAHELLMQGLYVNIVYFKTGDQINIDPDVYAENFDGEFVVTNEIADFRDRVWKSMGIGASTKRRKSSKVTAAWYEGGDIVMYFNGEKIYEGQPGADMYDAILPLCQDDATRLKFQEWCNQFGDPLFDDEYGDAAETAYTFCELIYYNFVDDENNYEDGNGILNFEIFPATEEVTGAESVKCASSGATSYDIYEVADPDGNVIEAFDSYEDAEAYANKIIKDTGVDFYDIFHVVAGFDHETGKWGEAEVDELVGQVMASSKSVKCASENISAAEYNQMLADMTLGILHDAGYKGIGCAVTDEALSFYDGTEDDVVYIQPTDEITPILGDEDADAEELAAAVKSVAGKAVEATTYDDLEPINGDDSKYGYTSNGDPIDESTVDELYRIAEREVLPTTELAKVDEYATIMEDTFEYYASSPYVGVTYTIKATFDTDDIDIDSYVLPDATWYYSFRAGKEVGELEFYIYVKGSEIDKVELIWNSSNLNPNNYDMEAIEEYVKGIAKPAAEAIYNAISNI